MLLVASCYRNRDKLRPDEVLASYADVTHIPYTVHEIRNRFYWFVPQSVVNSYCVLGKTKPEKRTKTYNKERVS